MTYRGLLPRRNPLALVLPLESRVLCAAGDIDTSYGREGPYTFTDDIFLQPAVSLRLADGRTLIGSANQVNTYNTGHPDDGDVEFFGRRGKYDLVMLNALGGRDERFGRFGTLDTTLDAISAAREMPDGSVLLFGAYDRDETALGLQAQAAIIRVDATGRQDLSFGDRFGRRLVDQSLYAGSSVLDVAITAQNQIVLLLTTAKGNATTSGIPYVMRFRASGGVDRSILNELRTANIVSLSNSNGVSLRSGRLAVAEDGSIYVGGDAFYVNDRGQRVSVGFSVAKLRPDGAFDESYGQAGIASAAGVAGVSVGAVHLDAQGRVLVYGSSERRRQTGDGGSIRVVSGLAVRFDASGQVDSTFAGGKFEAPSHDVNRVAGERLVAQDAVGRYVIADGESIYRLSESGEYDAAFGLVLMRADFLDISDPDRVIAVNDRTIAAVESGATSQGSQARVAFNAGFGSVLAYGTNGADRINIIVDEAVPGVAAFSRVHATVNGIGRAYPATGVRQAVADGGAGDDAIGVWGDFELGTNVSGSNGNDNIYVRASLATIGGGAGNDVIEAERAGNRIEGDFGNDTLAGGGFSLGDADPLTTIIGLTGNDLIRARGRSIIDAGNDHDTVIGSDRRDTIIGGLGNDSLEGAGGPDSITGDDGNDILVGGGGHDTLRGGAGRDRLIGRSGADLLDGGAGIDIFFAIEDEDTVISDARDSVFTA